MKLDNFICGNCAKKILGKCAGHRNPHLDCPVKPTTGALSQVGHPDIDPRD